MAKFTIVGDPHAKKDNLEKILKLFRVVEMMDNPVIWLGDFLDTKEVIRGKCLNLIYNNLKDSKLDHYIIIGNHDWFNLECKDHALQVLKELENVVVIDEPHKFDLFNIIPYIQDEAELKKAIKSMDKTKPLFGHLELKGFDYGNGRICEVGLSSKSVAKFPRIISGHFHKYQEKGNLTYLGTPFSHNFGETNQEKFIGEYDLDADNLSLIKTNFPRHITNTRLVDDPKMGTIGEFGKEGDYLRVILEGTQENINLFDRAVHPKGTRFIEKATDGFNDTTSIDESQSNMVKFETWAKDIKKLDEETIKMGLAILESLT